METNLKVLLDEIRDLEKSVAEQLKKKEVDFRYSITDRKVVFARDVQKKQRALKQSLFRFLRESTWPSLLVAPVIYSMVLPALLLDLFTFLYQAICFPVYGIPKVRRSDYIVFDRHRLKYLNWIERMNCEYCTYFNGLIAYVRELASRTEQYFCPIRHALAVKGQHPRHANFLPFGDADDYPDKFTRLRDQVRQTESPDPGSPEEITACGEPKK